MLDEANQSHPNIKLVRQLGTSVSFLDVYIESQNGTLVTSVYHKEAAEPYIVPFKSDHLQHVFYNIIDVALTRAIRYSSTLSAFDEERRFVKLKLLYNGYPPRYIHSRFMKFFTNYKRIFSIIPLLNTEYEYTFVRDYLLRKPTSSEYLTVSCIAKTIDSPSDDPTDDPLVRQQLRNQSKRMNKLIIHYVHEARLVSFKQDIHQLWDKTFKETPVTNTKLIVGNRNSPNATQILVHRCPQQAISANMIDHNPFPCTTTA